MREAMAVEKSENEDEGRREAFCAACTINGVEGFPACLATKNKGSCFASQKPSSRAWLPTAVEVVVRVEKEEEGVCAARTNTWKDCDHEAV